MDMVIGYWCCARPVLILNIYTILVVLYCK